MSALQHAKDSYNAAMDAQQVPAHHNARLRASTAASLISIAESLEAKRGPRPVSDGWNARVLAALRAVFDDCLACASEEACYEVHISKDAYHEIEALLDEVTP